MEGMERLLDEEEEVDGAQLREHLRMVLVGKTGEGKSATGNTILRRRVFESKLSAVTVTSECRKVSAQFEDQTVVIVDTPGLLESGNNQRETKREIATCISLAAPGPHVFLFVIQVGRFLKEDQKAVNIIKKMFGKHSPYYTMALFTHGDKLEGITIEDFIGQNSDLQQFINQCRGGYHVFNNETDDPSQVRQLLEKINRNVKKNGGRYFTNELFAKAERAIQEETEQLLRENPRMRRSEARKRAEKKNKYTEGSIVGGAALAGGAAGVGIGIAIEAGVGGTVGAVGGPVGAAVGVFIGAVAGIIAVLAREKN